MGKKNFPRSGSLAYYPKKRAKKETPIYRSVPSVEGDSKALSFVGYKAGMTHLIAKNAHDKSKTFGLDLNIPVTLIECPPLLVFGVRAYHKTPHGLRVHADVYAEKVAKELIKKIPNFKKPSTKETKKKAPVKTEEKKPTTLADLKSDVENTDHFTLIVHTQPKLTGIGKKKPDVFEVHVSGDTSQQLSFAEEKLGKTISISDCFEQGKFVDVKAVDKGKGMTGPVKRAGIRIHRPKAKKRRVVGSISPWSPATVMWTVARPGQLGYQVRTEYNRKVLMIGNTETKINPVGGFKQFGLIKNDFMMVVGSIPGPAKRAVAIRNAMRKFRVNATKIDTIDYIASLGMQQAHATQAEEKAVKVEQVKEEKVQKKSVQDEIAEAAGGKK